MAYIDCKLKSQILGTTVGVKLYFPTDLPAEVGNTVKGVLTLLHGYTNCGEDWLQMTAAAALRGGQRSGADYAGLRQFLLPEHGVRRGISYLSSRKSCRLLLRTHFPAFRPRAGTRTLSRGFPWAATARCIWAFPGRTSGRAAPAFPARWTLP